MNSRERVLLALEHKEPDRIPLDLGSSGMTTISKTVNDRLKELFGIKSEDEPIIDISQGIVLPDEEIIRRFGIDIKPVFPGKPDSWDLSIDEEGKYTDEWGVIRKGAGPYFDLFKSPLYNAEIEDILKYRWPDPRDPGRARDIKQKAVDLYENSGFAVAGNPPIAGLMYQCCLLRGFENFLFDLAGDKNKAHALLETLTDLYVDFIDFYLREVGNYIDIFITGDDLGTQIAPFLSLNLYREMLEPYHRRLIEEIKKRTSAKLFWHSCGAIYDFIPDLIDIGVDILNPIQTAAAGMDIVKMKKNYGDQLVLHGAIDEQFLLTNSRPDQVKEGVKKVIDIMAPGGGYILCATHNIQPNVPIENIVSVYETALKYGVY
ncbi:MAG: hypothetical protein M1371_11385 [Actinobacteria bacterium]|nr:hypothetical protein [Actinomycetota bacterium]